MKSSNILRFLLLIPAMLLIFLPVANTQQPMSRQTAPTENRVCVVFIGNSITAGAGLPNRTVEAPPVHAAEYIRNHSENVQVEYSNQGVSGFTTVDFLPATGTAFSRVIAAADRLADQEGVLMFSISLGTNDSAEAGPNGSPLSAPQYHDNLKIIADSLLTRFPGCLITIHHPLWYSPNTYNRARYLSAGLERLQTYSPAITALVHEYAQTHQGRVFEGDKEGYGYFEHNYLSDMQHESGVQGIFYLHPNVTGAAALGRLWGKALTKTLREYPAHVTKEQP